MKKKKNILFLLPLISLSIPEIAFATKYIVCGNNKVFPLVVADLISILMNIVKIVIPILLVISGMISFFKVTFSNNVEDEMKKAQTKLIHSIIAAVVIFFIISIINFAVSLVAGSNNNVMDCVKCLMNPNKCEQMEEKEYYQGGKKICPGFVGDEYDENCNPKQLEKNSSSDTNNSNQSNDQAISTQTTSLDGFLFIGDSRYDGIRNDLQSLGSNVNVSAVVGKSAIDWLNNSTGEYQLPATASNISVMLGVNSPNVEHMKRLFDKLHEKYPNSTIYANSVYHVGTAYTAGYITNSQIDAFNNSIQQIASHNNWIVYVDVTSGLYDENGYLKSEYTSDGLHMNASGNNILISNIKSKILR